MAIGSQMRGHRIYWDGSYWRYADNNDFVPLHGGKERACKKCGMFAEKGEPDPYIGYLPGVINACCGHGDNNHSYVMFENGVTFYHFSEIVYFKK